METKTELEESDLRSLGSQIYVTKTNANVAMYLDVHRGV